MRRLATESLTRLANELDLTLLVLGGCPIEKGEASLESDLADAMSAAWVNAASEAMPPALEQLMAGELNKERITVFVKSMGLRLRRPLTPEQIEILAGKVRGIYQIAQETAASKLKRTVDFAMRDQRAAAAIGRTQAMWCGDFYSSQISDRIKAVSEDVLLNRGYGYTEAGRELGKALELEFGIRPGGRSEFAPNIPARYAGNPDLYFRQLASVSSHQAHVYGRMSTFSQAGVKTYRLSNPLDERTGSVCRVLAGNVFTVPSATAQIDRMAEAKNPDDVRDVQDWLGADRITEMLGGAKSGSLDATKTLTSAGIQLPPFHPLCVGRGAFVFTSNGRIPIEFVKKDDFVFTHRGRYRRVTRTSTRLFTGQLIRIAERKLLGLTSDHLIGGIDDGQSKFFEAGELCSSSRIIAIRACVFALWKENVSCPIEECRSILLQSMRSKRSESSARSKKEADNGDGHLCSMWNSIRDYGDAIASRPSSLRHEMPCCIHGYGNNSAMCCLRKTHSRDPFAESRRIDLFTCVSKYIGSQRTSKASKFSRSNDRTKQSHVREASECPLDNLSFCSKWRDEAARLPGSAGCHGTGRTQDTIRIRTEDVSAVSGHELYPRLFGARNVDRGIGMGKANQETQNDDVRKARAQILDSAFSPNPKWFEAIPAGEILREQVVDLPVCDLSVEEDETFVVEGFIVHNCRTEVVLEGY